jgi:hypothetical protein
MMLLIPLAIASAFFSLLLVVHAILGSHDFQSRASDVNAAAFFLGLATGGMTGLTCTVAALVVDPERLPATPGLRVVLVAGIVLAQLLTIQLIASSVTYPRFGIGPYILPILPASAIALLRLRRPS